MVDKTHQQDSNIVEFSLDLERNLARAAHAYRLEHTPKSRPRPSLKEAMPVASGLADDQPPPFDFSFHGPTANDMYVVKLAGFASVMAVGIVIAGFGIAAGLLKLFT